MTKYLKIFLFSIAAVGILSGSAFAAASLNAGNTTVASELIGAAGTAIPQVFTGYSPDISLAASTRIKISLTNGTFAAGSTIDLCDNAGNAYSVAPAVVGATAAASVVIVTDLALAAGGVYNLQPAACVVGAGTVPLTNVVIAAGSTGGAQVIMTFDNDLSPSDPNVFASAVVTTLVNQFSVELSPVTSSISFDADLKLFLNTGNSSTNSFVLLSNETIGTKVLTGLAGNTACGIMGGGAGAKNFKFTATPGTGNDFKSVLQFIFSTTGFVLDGAILAADTSATGDLVGVGAIRVCGAAASSTFKDNPANRNSLTLTVNGTDVLTPRIYNLKIATITAGEIVAAPRDVLAQTLGWTWKLDATQFYISLVGSVPPAGRETFIKLQSKSDIAGSNGVKVAILATDGSTTSVFDAGTIQSGVPMVITGAQLAVQAAADGKEVDGALGFAVIITVNTPRDHLFAYANIIDTSGAKRVPVQTLLPIPIANVTLVNE